MSVRDLAEHIQKDDPKIQESIEVVEEKKSKLYTVEVTDTWRVEVDADSEDDAKEKVLAMTNTGYDKASDFDGAEVTNVELFK